MPGVNLLYVRVKKTNDGDGQTLRRQPDRSAVAGTMTPERMSSLGDKGFFICSTECLKCVTHFQNAKINLNRSKK